MTTMPIRNRFQEQLEREKKRMIADTRCRICREPIGEKDYITFEERYFHAFCIKKGHGNQPGRHH